MRPGASTSAKVSALKRGREGTSVSAVFAQMPARQGHEYVLKAGMARRQAGELAATRLHEFQQRRQREVNCGDGQDVRIFLAPQLNDGGGVLELAVRQCGGFFETKFDEMVAADARDQFRRRSQGDDFAVIDDGDAVAQAFGFIHVVRGQENSSSVVAQVAQDVPELAA